MSNLGNRLARVEAQHGAAVTGRLRVLFVDDGETEADARAKMHAKDRPLDAHEKLLIVRFVAPEPDGGDNGRA